MKFVDETWIEVQAGQGGDGCLSFRRERCVPRGGPDGGNGGEGGSVVLCVDTGLQTLADFRPEQRFQAQGGAAGGSNCRTGRRGEDLHLRVPPGTRVMDVDTQQVLGELIQAGDRLPVALGGAGGIGNLHFKSSRNRSPTRTIPGHPGEQHNLHLELLLLAEVGLLGRPNAGKSSLLRAISRARPRVASYPFTTLYPCLGIVELELDLHLRVADIPGMIEGAASGVGLGIRFLRHLGRTRLLLHLIDISAAPVSQLVEQVRGIERELQAHDRGLLERPRWLVLNKIDLLGAEQCARIGSELLQALEWRSPSYSISAQDGRGCMELCRAAAHFLMDSESRQEQHA